MIIGGSDCKLYKEVEGHLQIKSGSNCTIYGLVRGSLTVEPGASLKLYGSVIGEIYNHEEADVEIYGTVSGRLCGLGIYDIYGVVATSDAPKNSVQHKDCVIIDAGRR